MTGTDAMIHAKALIDVVTERGRQDAKWGVQNHPAEWWLAILGEEFWELAQAILETHFDNGPSARKLGGRSAIRKEAVQCAAVAMALVECLDRNSNDDYPRPDADGGV